MNDLMTKSFLSYVELKKQAQKDLESEHDIEKGQIQLSHKDEENLSQFYQEVAAIKSEMEEITNLLSDLKSLDEEAKSTHSTKLLRGLRDRMDSNIVAVLRKLRIIKAQLEGLDQSNVNNRRTSEAYREGSHVDRTRITITNGLRVKLREMMANFQALREKILSDHKEELRRKYYVKTGELPSDESIEKMASGAMKVEFLEGTTDEDMGNKAKHETVMDIQRSLNKLHQVFLDMAILVQNQGEKMDDIEENFANAANYINGGTNSLYYAKQMKGQGNKYIYWIWAVVVIILLVCIISMLAT
ncbi:hypothetical protein UlMin_039552 [Ulmus minor]